MTITRLCPLRVSHHSAGRMDIWSRVQRLRCSIRPSPYRGYAVPSDPLRPFLERPERETAMTLRSRFSFRHLIHHLSLSLEQPSSQHGGE